MDITVLKTRHYVGIGFYHTGDQIIVPDAVGEQFIKQGFAVKTLKKISTKSRMKECEE